MADIPLKSLTFPGVNNVYINTPISSALQFSTSTNYVAGDYVYYNRNLYKFIQTHTASPWSDQHVQAVTICGELSDIRSELSAISSLTNAEEVAF